jgi:hypothetical protein
MATRTDPLGFASREALRSINRADLADAISLWLKDYHRAAQARRLAEDTHQSDDWRVEQAKMKEAELRGALNLLRHNVWEATDPNYRLGTDEAYRRDDESLVIPEA